jgi:energy-coupling factor transporter ATP-binding protein EcfA2
MTRSTPYYTNEQEKKELIALRDSFSFDEEYPTNDFVVVAGPPGSGKTHLLCTMSDTMPVYILDTEYRAHIVVRKFAKAKHQVKSRFVRNYQELVAGVKYILKHFKPPAMIVLDSGTDLQGFAESEYLRRVNREKVGMAWNWPEVWDLCNAVVDDIKFSGFTLGVTTRIKEEYVNEKSTGREVPRIYSALPYKADLALQFGGRDRKPSLIKNGYGESLEVPLTRIMTLPEIFKAVKQ